MDMRDFLNAPNGLSKQTLAVNERNDAEPPRSPLGGRTVCEKFVQFLEKCKAWCFLVAFHLGSLSSLNSIGSWFWGDCLQDVFDLPFHMARDQIEESLRTKMASIKVSHYDDLLAARWWSIILFYFLFFFYFYKKLFVNMKTHFIDKVKQNVKLSLYKKLAKDMHKIPWALSHKKWNVWFNDPGHWSDGLYWW